MHFFTSYGIVRAVDRVNLAINKNETVGLVGESGCGKTATAFSIMRLVPPPGKIIDGQILFEEKNLLDFEEKEMRNVRGKKISMIFQDPLTHLNPVMKIEDQIAEAMALHEKKNMQESRKKTIELLSKVQIPNPKRVAKSYPYQLSGGMKQRVLIAIAISCSPTLLIADEPTTALDVTVQAQILELITSLIKDLNTSLLLITHDLGIVAETCDKVFVMYAGKIVENCNVFQIFSNAKHPYAQGLFESTLSIDEYKEVLVTLDGAVPSLVNPPPGCKFHPRCPKAKTVCREREPELVEVEPGHFVACWLCQ